MNAPSPSPDVGRIRFRKLRIAWSAFWGIACLLFIVLWVRSYSHNDVIVKNVSSRFLFLNSWKGRLSYWQSISAPSPRIPLTSYALGVDDIIQGGSDPVMGFGR